jgi:hypothetical protein
MFIVFLGLVMLLAILLPFGAMLTKLITGGMYGAFFREFPPIVYHITSFAMAYLPIMLVVGVFMAKANLRDRLPDPVPGKTWLLFGIIFGLLPIASILFASTIQGGGASFVVAQFVPFVMLVAKALLIVGAVKVLLSAEPASA